MNSIVGQRLEDFRIGHGVTARRDGRGEGRSLASVVNSAAEQWPYYHAYRVCPLPSTLPRTGLTIPINHATRPMQIPTPPPNFVINSFQQINKT